MVWHCPDCPYQTSWYEKVRKHYHTIHGKGYLPEGDKSQMPNYFIICKKCKGWHEKGNWCQDSNDYIKGMDIVIP